ncbi:MAG: amidohydrolase family protein [Ilumatobacteraceae bacterium]
MLPPAAQALADEGYLVLPAFAEPHAHLDKAFLAERVENPTGDLLGAILAMQQARPSITLADTIERAERAALLLSSNGCTAIRTHVDLTVLGGLSSVEALIDVRDRLRGVVDIQVAALCAWPSVGAEGADQRALLRDAIAMGIDVVGGCPHLESDPVAANDNFLSIAAEAGLPVDLHTDETLDPSICALEDLAERVVATGFGHGVTASHCVSLSLQPVNRQQEIAEKVAAAGINVIALPHTNLFLQGRDCPVATPRALTAVRALQQAGVNVAAGADNLQDPFNPVGRGDPLETASLMIMASHALPADALAMISDAARRTMGLGPNTDYVAVRATSIREAIAFGPADRVVVRHGSRLVTERSRDRV